MAQLLVRDLEPKVVSKLRRRAALEGVSVEEAHRRLLRKALNGSSEAPPNFIEFLQSIPKGGDIKFRRATDLPRKVSL
jgi:plasmid stability protein